MPGQFFLKAFVLCFVATAALGSGGDDLDCSGFLSGMDQVRQEKLSSPWLDELTFEANEARVQRRTFLLVRAYASLLEALARAIPEFRETGLFVYPVSGPDVLFQRFAPVFSINRDPIDFEIGRKLLEIAELPNDYVSSSPSRLFQDPNSLVQLQMVPNKPRTLILKLFDLFTASIAPAKKEALLLEYLTEVQNVLILHSEDSNRWLPLILKAGFEITIEKPLHDGLTLAVGTSVQGRNKSILIPDTVVFLKKKAAP